MVFESYKKKKRIKNPQKVSYFLHPNEKIIFIEVEREREREATHTFTTYNHLVEERAKTPVQKVITNPVFRTI